MTFCGLSCACENVFMCVSQQGRMSKEPTVMRTGSTDRYGEEEVHSPTARASLSLWKCEDVFTIDTWWGLWMLLGRKLCKGTSEFPSNVPQIHHNVRW